MQLQGVFEALKWSLLVCHITSFVLGIAAEGPHLSENPKPSILQYHHVWNPQTERVKIRQFHKIPWRFRGDFLAVWPCDREEGEEQARHGWDIPNSSPPVQYGGWSEFLYLQTAILHIWFALFRESFAMFRESFANSIPGPMLSNNSSYYEDSFITCQITPNIMDSLFIAL